MRAARWILVARLASAGLSAFLAWQMILVRHTGGTKGSAVPLTTVLVCLVIAWLVTFLMWRLFSPWAAPFAGGVAGALSCGSLNGPYGGALGLLIGLAFVLIPWASVSRLARGWRRSSWSRVTRPELPQ